MTDATRRIAALAFARQRLTRQDDRLRKRIAALSRERNAIEQACEEQRVRVQEVDRAVAHEQSRIDAMTGNDQPFSIDVLMQANRCVDAFFQARAALVARLDQLIEEAGGKDKEMVQARREIAMNQFRDTIYAERAEAIRSEVTAHRDGRVDDEAEEMAWMRRVAATRIDE
ncbi:hypothetical protein [Burkholderia ubonensis]|uniref:hypothetical protein n=1 Tax=Burkholderia ubonensis TaxID=101571 RepID=UPI00075A98F0|nr:hypothetical protein [Burkholderia ubonensis]KWK69123.1 hypothetical protein WM15_00045 [Burkholderia ubonensis]